MARVAAYPAPPQAGSLVHASAGDSAGPQGSLLGRRSAGGGPAAAGSGTTSTSTVEEPWTAGSWCCPHCTFLNLHSAGPNTDTSALPECVVCGRCPQAGAQPGGGPTSPAHRRCPIPGCRRVIKKTGLHQHVAALHPGCVCRHGCRLVCFMLYVKPVFCLWAPLGRTRPGPTALRVAQTGVCQPTARSSSRTV